jgi:hypothetical protein
MKDDKSNSAKAPATSRASDGPMDMTPSPKSPDKGKAPATQDRWFDTQLSRMYADLAAEPLPKEMLSLLEKLKSSKS